MLCIRCANAQSTMVSTPYLDFCILGFLEQNQHEFRSDRGVHASASASRVFARISPSGNSTREGDGCFWNRLLDASTGSAACTSSALERQVGRFFGSIGSRHAKVLFTASSPGGLCGRSPTVATRPCGGHEGLKTTRRSPSSSDGSERDDRILVGLIVLH